MHIKEVNISGFRSYREGTSIDNFSPRHNVVVGRNGSGKSNFFFAIQFVLSDEFAHLKREQRAGILHEGTGPRISSARVEIVFDNSDRRIAAIEAIEVRVARQVGEKKDQYTIDGKIVPRAEVVNLMESAGFSRSNPYYIVKQGKINELATSPDSHRLKLLREVAGTRVYDERKEESMKILEENKQKTRKIEELLKFIEERLKTLEEEKEDLKEYQKWDKMKRSIEYTMLDTDVNETRKKLDKLADQREEMNSRQLKVNSSLVDIQARGSRASAEQRKLEARFKGMKEEKEGLSNEQSERYEKRTELDLLIKDLQEDVARERSGRDVAEDTRRQLLAEIAEKEDELEKIVPRYQKLAEQESALISDIRIAETRAKELFAKQGQRDQFKTSEERDNFLRKELRQISRQICDVQDRLNEIQKSMEEEQQEEERLNYQIRELSTQLQENHINMEKTSREHAEMKQECERAIVVQMDSNRREKDVRDQLNNVLNDIQQQQNLLCSIVPRSTMNGVDGVKQILKWFEEHNEDGRYTYILKGYHGRVIELFDCDSVYFQAVDVTAGNRLFYHVVSDDKVASEILKQFNKQHKNGECNFYPINRTTGNRRSVQDPDARAMLDILDYDEAFESIFAQMFGDTAIVRNMVTGSRLAKNEGFNCVTMEGDQVSRRGALTGGYLDTKRNKLEVHQNIRTLEEQRDQLKVSLEEEQGKANEKINAVEKIRLGIDKLENELRHFKQNHRNLTDQKRELGDRLINIGRMKDSKANQLMNTKNRIREMDAQKANLEGQLGTELQSQLTGSEQNECEKLQRLQREKKQQLDGVSKERSKLETIKNKLENQLQTNLLRKRDSLTTKIDDISVDEKKHNLQEKISELASVNERLNAIRKRLDELDESLMEYEESAEKLGRELEDVQEQQKDLEAQITEFSKQADIICTKQSALQTKREETVKKIRDLGSLPTDAFSKYQGMSTKALDKKLEECLNELKKYENVNKKALDQFVQAASQKDELAKRMEDQEKSKKSIEDLLEALELRKYDAIHLTFKQVSKNFVEVFKKLVPTGSGQLICQTAAPSSQDSEPPESQNSVAAMVERFVGIGIKVSFTGTSETREMQQLSGGQKSLVALALIFSIQMCDPAPFYLFDEIDAALDAQHRKAVADMIHELSEKAQFVTTTFRPELLAHAEKYYGVRFRNKVSHIDMVTREQAYDFVEDDQTHG